MLNILNFINYFLCIFAVGFYLITVLQWFSYKFERIIFHFTKPLWHIYFLFFPVIIYFASFFIKNGDKFLFIFLVIFYILLILWHKKLDKKLVFTARVKRFFAFLAFFSILIAVSFNLLKADNLPLFSPFILTFLFSYAYEKKEANKFYKMAQKKLANMPDLLIIQITASFGKTSIKNFLFELLKDDFKVQKTPRSVNTLNGIIRDINENLSYDTKIYIAEAGARKNGDIKEITQFLNPQIVLVGEIGAQHIEYFKSIENIRATKLESLSSNRLKHAFLHSTTLLKENEINTIYDKQIANFTANLDGIKLEMKSGEKIFAEILGDFNAQNLAACILIAKFLGINAKKIAKNAKNLHSVEHRLQKIMTNEKFIIDDSFNGNLKGMCASYDLVKNYKGRKVIITPGIVEGTKEMNEILGIKINEIFDLVMITGDLNAEILGAKIDPKKLIFIKDKSKMIEILGAETKADDLILFSNDAPSFI